MLKSQNTWENGKTCGLRELNKLRCRARILKVSRRLFTQKGYDNTKLEDIAAAAEISRATLYNYFESKENLLLGIAEAALDEVRHLVEVELAQEPSSLEKLCQAIEVLTMDAVRYTALTRRIFYLNSSSSNALHVPQTKLLSLIADLACQAQKQGTLRTDLTADELSNIFFGVYLQALFGWADIETYTQKVCRSKVRAAIECVLTGIAGEEER